MFESNHLVLRGIFLRIQSASPLEDPRLLISKMFRVSIDLYGNNVASSHELANGYTRPIITLFPLQHSPRDSKSSKSIFREA